jgi:hypothetical protein
VTTLAFAHFSHLRIASYRSVDWNPTHPRQPVPPRNQSLSKASTTSTTSTTSTPSRPLLPQPKNRQHNHTTSCHPFAFNAVESSATTHRTSSSTIDESMPSVFSALGAILLWLEKTTCPTKIRNFVCLATNVCMHRVVPGANKCVEWVKN